jgi:hypothetical protein
VALDNPRRDVHIASVKFDALSPERSWSPIYPKFAVLTGKQLKGEKS